MTASFLIVFGIFAAACVAATLTFVVLDRRDERKYEGRHAQPPAGRHAFADDRDVTDPHGDRWVTQLHHEGRFTLLSREECEAAAVAFAEKHERHARPGSPPPTSAAADTGEINIAVAEWGMSAQAKADELAAKYLTAEVPH